MAIVIPDLRIGYKNTKGQVIQRPTYYATGEYWNVKAVSAPTQCWFGIKSRFYYILPVSVPRLSPEVVDELKQIAEEYTPKLFPDLIAEAEEKRARIEEQQSAPDTSTLDVKSQDDAVLATPEPIREETSTPDIAVLLQQAVQTMSPEELQAILMKALTAKKEDTTNNDEQ